MDTSEPDLTAHITADEWKPEPSAPAGWRVVRIEARTYDATGQLVEVAVYDEAGKVISRLRPVSE